MLLVVVVVVVSWWWCLVVVCPGARAPFRCTVAAFALLPPFVVVTLCWAKSSSAWRAADVFVAAAAAASCGAADHGRRGWRRALALLWGGSHSAVQPSLLLVWRPPPRCCARSSRAPAGWRPAHGCCLWSACALWLWCSQALEQQQQANCRGAAAWELRLGGLSMRGIGGQLLLGPGAGCRHPAASRRCGSLGPRPKLGGRADRCVAPPIAV